MTDLAAQTPLLDLLRSVPADARLSYEHSPTSHSMIPAGRLCHEAADEIVQLRGEITVLERMNDDLADEVDRLRALTCKCVENNAEIERLRNYIHSCHPGCQRAGCVNERLRAAAQQARVALSDLIASGDPVVYSDALRALDEALK